MIFFADCKFLKYRARDKSRLNFQKSVILLDQCFNFPYVHYQSTQCERLVYRLYAIWQSKYYTDRALSDHSLIFGSFPVNLILLVSSVYIDSTSFSTSGFLESSPS